MDDDKRKPVMIGIIIACVALAVGVTIYTTTGGGGGGGGGAKGKLTILCTECGESSELSRDEFREKMQASADQGMMGLMGPMGGSPVLTCSACGEDAAQLAVKCKECDTVFTQDYEAAAEGDYSDRCPECDYSETEEKMNQVR